MSCTLERCIWFECDLVIVYLLWMLLLILPATCEDGALPVRRAPPDVCHCHFLSLSSPLLSSTRIGRLTMRKLLWYCSPQPVYINIGRWLRETGHRQNVWTTRSQSVIRSGCWTLVSGTRDVRAGVTLRTSPKGRPGVDVCWHMLQFDLLL